MAQPGNFTPILIYGSSTPTNVPLAANLTNSATGSEIAINVADKNLFFKDSGGTVNTVPIRQSGTSSNGWLSSTDWNTFNNKAPATSGTSILYGNGSGGFSNVTIGSGVSFAGGILSATGSGGTVTSVTGTSPVVSSGGTTPAISLATAYGDTLNPYASKTANYILAAPNGSAGVPTFRALVAADVTGLGAMATQNANAVAITGGTINGTTIGATTASTGAFTTATASTSVTTPIVQATNSAGLALRNSAGTTQISMGAGGGDNVTVAVSTNLNGTNAQIDISPTGTGHVHIKPSGTGAVEIAPTNAGTMNNMVIGGTTPLAGSFTDLSVTGTTSFDGSQGTSGQVLTSQGTGVTPIWTTPTTGTVTSVTGTAPVVSSGGATPAISMAAATTSVNGYLTSTDWTTFNSKQAALVSGTNIKTVGGVSLLGSGDVGVIGATYGGTGVNNGSNTITIAGNLNHAGAFTQTFTATANTSLTLPTSGYLISTVTNMAANPVTGTPSILTFLRGDGTWATPAGGGTVTSVAATVPAFLSVSGSPIVTSGTLAITLSGTALPVANGGTGVTTSTGSGNTVLSTSPTLTTPKATTTIGVGNATAAATGAGVSFPATQSASSDANTLDDYAEGSWTPGFVNGTFTYSAFNRGYYTKIGNQVTASALLIWTAVSGTGDLAVTLPFTAGLTFARYAGSFGNVNGVDNGGNHQLTLGIDSGNNYAAIRYLNDNAAATISQVANLSASGEIHFTITYFV